MLKILWLTAVALTALVLAGILGIQTPQVQTYLSHKLLKNIADKIDAEIDYEKVHVKPFNTIVLKNVTVRDREPFNEAAYDTLFAAEYVIARFTLKGLRKQEGLHVWSAYIRDAEMNLVVEDNGTNLERMFGIKKNPEKKKRDKNVFDIRRVDIDGMSFRMMNFKKEHKPAPAGTIDWNNLDISDIHIAARNLKMSKGVLSGRLDYLSFNEKSGFSCQSLSGKTKVGNGKALIEDLEISDLWSDIRIPSFIMSYSNSKDFKDFVNRVRLDAGIADSRLSMKTLSFFVPGLGDNGLEAAVSGKVSGLVSSLQIDGLSIDATDKSISGIFSGRLTGLPETDRMYMDMELKDVKFDMPGLEKFIGHWNGGKAPELKKYAEGATFTLDGNIRGTLNRLGVDISATSGIGGLSASLDTRNLTSKRQPTIIGGAVRSYDLDLGAILGTGLVGQCSMKAGLHADLGNSDDGASIRLDSLMVSRLNIHGYDYGNIAAAGKIAREAFDGKIVCNDPNLNFMFQGLFNLSRKTSNALYKFYMNVGYADLNAMNIDKRGISRISFQTSANFNKIRNSDLLGDISIGGIVLENGMGKYNIGDIGISSYSNDNISRVKFSSEFAEGSYTGTGSLQKFVKDFSSVTLRKELPSMFRDTVSTWKGEKYDLTFRCHDTMDLLSFLAPGLYIADSSFLRMSIDTSGLFKARLNSQRIAFKDQYIKDIDCTFSNCGGILDGELNSESIRIATLMLMNNRIDLFADNDHLGLGFSYDNESTLTNRGEFFATGDVTRDDDGKMKLDISLLPSSIYLNSREWSIAPSKFSIKGKEINVENIGFNSGDQTIRIYGATSDKTPEKLVVSMERFDISIINPLLKKDLRIGGAMTGTAELYTPYGNLGLAANFLCDSTTMAGTGMGTVTIKTTWDENQRKFGFDIGNSLAGKPSFLVSGSYGTRNRTLDAEAILDRFDVSCASPFTESIFSDIGGHISGKMNLNGPVRQLSMATEGMRLEDTELRIAYTNVPYRLNGDFHLDESGIYFDDIRMEDRKEGRGNVRGNISYEHFKNIRFNTEINVRNMECIDIAERNADAFYGNVSATGTVSLTGPMKSLLMSVEAVTTGDGQFHVPVSSSANAGGGNLLTFKKPVVIKTVDPYETMVARLKEHESTSGHFSMKLRLAATQGTEAFIEIDKSTGNVLSGRGEGVIDLEIQPDKDIFNITGDYTISSGNYRFVALGLASRDFSIQEGSSIKFNGDIMESTLDINAVYRTKASLSTLIADTTSVSNRRTVECGISITDKLRNPRLGFSIDIPDLDPTVQSRVESALSTEDKVQKQFLYLIISNSFLPDEQSGIVNNNSILYSNVTDIMANQLNNIFQKLDIPLDLGLSYQPNDKGNDIFDVAVSTQLFNNRVIVNGNIGNRQYNSGNSNSDVVGDLDIEIKLTRNGALRLNLFSHSADEYTNYLDNSQRNGVGLAYQKEFDRFDTFIKNMFTSKKKREETERQEMEALRMREMNVVIIDGDSTGRDQRKEERKAKRKIKAEARKENDNESAN